MRVSVRNGGVWAASTTRPQLVVVAVELVDHQGAVAVTDQAVHEVLHGRPQDRLVVTGEEVGGHDEGDS